MKYAYLFLIISSLQIYCQNSEPINFDGVVNTDEWANFPSFDISYEIQPGNNTPSFYNTKAYVAYSKTHMYVGFDAEVPKDELRSSIRNRDEAYQDDFVMICVDTFGDGRYMICIGSNANGSQLDMKFIADDGEPSFDLYFDNKAQIFDNGYNVEMKIPFSAFQFKNKSRLTWNTSFYRKTFANGSERDNLDFPIDRNNPCVACQTKTELVFKNIKPKLRLNLLPYVYSGVEGNADENSIIYGKPKFSFGLSGRADLSYSTSLEYTINPDFSQVEADVSQINVNNTFALFYPERRPFFNEGADLVSTELNTVYTRMINKPLLSTKLIHQDEKQRIYWLAAYDTKTAYIIGGENQSYSGEGKENFSNILRYQRNYSKGSNFGALITNRILKGGGSDHTFGLSGRHQFLKSYTVNFELNKSITNEPENDWIEQDGFIKSRSLRLDGESYSGDAVLFDLSRTTQNWESSIGYEQLSPLYRTPLGFAIQNASKSIYFRQNYIYYGDNFIQKAILGADLEWQFNYDNIQKNGGIELEGELVMKNNLNTSFKFEHKFNNEFEGFNPKNLNFLFWRMGYSPSEVITLRFGIEIGDEIGYNLEEIALGDMLNFGTFNSFQLSEKFIISPSLTYSELRNKLDGNLYYKGYITRINFNYQLNRDFSIRLITEYDDFDKTVFSQPLIKWNPNPFTLFYVGGNIGYSRAEANNRFTSESAQFYFKFQYLIGN
ncbi:MAG: hypothetical protein P8L83_06480 [Flavobacteriaceae bacterium]|nr:hypothetical protein [Flavobacteriaceae bacterium]